MVTGRYTVLLLLLSLAPVDLSHCRIPGFGCRTSKVCRSSAACPVYRLRLPPFVAKSARLSVGCKGTCEAWLGGGARAHDLVARKAPTYVKQIVSEKPPPVDGAQPPEEKDLLKSEPC